MELYYQTIGTGRPLVILHGLFGSSDNWRSIAKQLATKAQVITVDLRNHGRSPHSAEHSYVLMADDLAELLEKLKLDKVDLIGHSMGGKVAMVFSQRYPQKLRKLVVVDIAPRQYQDEHSRIFKALLAVDLSLYASRAEVDQALEQTLPNKAVRQFLLMNLALNEGQLHWQINLQALFDNYPQLLEAICETESTGKSIEIPSCFIRGSQSDYVRDDDEALIRNCFPNTQIITLNAGHWVHAEAPQTFLTKIGEFLNYD